MSSTELTSSLPQRRFWSSFPVVAVPLTVWILLFAASGFFFPDLYTWEWFGFTPSKSIAPLVQLVMLGMGLTLTVADFRRVFETPRAILLGVSCQFLIMPVLAWMIAGAMLSDPKVATGLILIGSCPGGVSSNVICYLARANVPLSITMTACSTLLSPVATPVAMKLLTGERLDLNVLSMMWSIVTLVVMPLVIGLLIHHLAPAIAGRMKRLVPGLAALAICLIIAITVALAASDLRSSGVSLFVAAVVMYALGTSLGYGAGRLFRLEETACRTLALEVGIQNGGMATGLAISFLKSPAAALGSAVYGPWSAIASSILAKLWSHRTAPVNAGSESDRETGSRRHRA